LRGTQWRPGGDDRGPFTEVFTAGADVLPCVPCVPDLDTLGSVVRVLEQDHGISALRKRCACHDPHRLASLDRS
jgi:hypothetical protein